MNTSYGDGSGNFRGVWLPDEGTGDWCLVLNEEEWKETRQDCQRILQAMMDEKSVAAALMFSELLHAFPTEWNRREVDWSMFQ